MKSFKLLAAAAVIAVSSFAANAEIISIGGVTWDTSSPNNFDSGSLNMRQFINTTTGELTGFGLVNGFNGTSVDQFCPTCEMTFQFDGFLPTGGTVIPGIGQTLNYSGGAIRIYVGPREIALSDYASYPALTWANTGGTPSQLFLELTNNYTFLGSNLLNLQLSGLGFLDVTGGFAATYFDTNTQEFGSDMAFSSSLNKRTGNVSITDMSGTASLSGYTVPEPSSLAILGLGLLGLAGAARRKQAK